MSSVIKAGGAAGPVQGIAFNFEDMNGQANAYLDQVRLKAGEIVVQAQKDAEAIRARAEEEGRQAALRAVEKVLDDKVGKKMETLLPALQQAVEGVQHAKQSWLRHWEKSAVHLSAAIAARVIRQELSRTPEITLGLLSEALELAAGSSQIRVYLNPVDFETLGSQAEKLIATMNRAGKTELVADAQVSAGGCRVDTQHGTIDQQIEAQLARIEAELV